MAAIYQWFEGGDVVYTTTLYPIEEREGVNFNISLLDAYYLPAEVDEYNFTCEFLSAGTLQVLLDGSAEDEYNFTVSFEEANITQILLDSAAEDEYAFTCEFLGGGLQIIVIVITGYSPDQGLILGIDLDTANTTLT